MEGVKVKLTLLQVFPNGRCYKYGSNESGIWRVHAVTICSKVKLKRRSLSRRKCYKNNSS